MASKSNPIKLNIIFVCTGNTCRSPMAEFLFKDYLKQKKRTADFSVSSAGLLAEKGSTLSPQADTVLTDLGVKHASDRKARVYTVQMAMDSDLIIAMSERHAERCSSDNALSFERIIGEPIPDPYGGTVEEYAACAEKMRSAFELILEIADKLLAKKREEEG